MAEVLRTNQLQMELLAEMTKTMGKLTSLLIPDGPPTPATGRYTEDWMIQESDDVA